MKVKKPKPNPRPIWSCGNIAFPLELSRTGRGRYTVQYGKQEKRNLDYLQAASELGVCLMHALACDGKVDSDNQQ
jgi:hypothetical protein